MKPSTSTESSKPPTAIQSETEVAGSQAPILLVLAIIACACIGITAFVSLFHIVPFVRDITGEIYAWIGLILAPVFVFNGSLLTEPLGALFVLTALLAFGVGTITPYVFGRKRKEAD